MKTDKTRKEKIWQSAEINAKPPDDKINVALAWLIAIVLFSAALLMRPLRKLRVGLLHYNAMGKFYGNTEYFLRERKYNPPKEKDLVLLISGKKPVNKQILTMVARQCAVIKNDQLWVALNHLKKNTPGNSLWIDLGCTGWLRGAEWTVPGPQLSFTPDEHSRGQAILRQLGIPKGAPHVCFFAKDRLYTDSPVTRLDPNSYWGSRDFRNCDIKNYLAAVQYLAAQGIYAIRMGIHRPAELLPSGLDSKIIDYTGAIRPSLDDPDFADAYLQATCKFFLGTTSGIYILSSMFGVPVAYANMIPYGESGRMPHDIVIFKNCRNRASGQLIPYADLIGRGIDADWLTLDELNKLDTEGIEFVENSGEEILGLAREMNMRLDGAWVPEPADDPLQQKAYGLFTARAFDGSGFPGRIGAEFLRTHRGLLGSEGVTR